MRSEKICGQIRHIYKGHCICQFDDKLLSSLLNLFVFSSTTHFLVFLFLCSYACEEDGGVCVH